MIFIRFKDKENRSGIFIGRESNIEQRSGVPLTDYTTLKKMFSGLFGETSSGVNVTEESSMGLSSVFSAVRVISEDIASVPIDVIRTTTKGNREKFNEHYLYELIHDKPNHYQTPFTFYDNLVALANLWGNGYARIHRDALGRPAELEIIHSSKVTYHLINRRLWYRVQGEIELVRYEDMIHICGPSFNGIAGVSMISLHRHTIGGGIAARDFNDSFYKNGAAVDGLLSTEQNLKQDQVDTYSENWNKKHTGIGNQHKTAVLGGGLKYQPIGIPQKDAQWIESMNYNREQVGAIFRVKPHKMGNLDRATFSNIEQLSIDHVNDTIRPWAKRIEMELSLKLFPEREQKTTQFKFNLNALMRGDAASRLAFYKGMKEIGAYSANDIRRLEGENPIENGDIRITPLAYISDEKANKYYDAQINSLNAKSNNDGNKE